MAQDPRDFLRRWSRRKRDTAARAPAATRASGELPPLPSPDSLTFESDFKAFMQAKVEESVKRAALRKLFADPRFNVMDGLDVYVDDYSKDDPIPRAMLETLQHARATLSGREEDKAQAQEEGKAQDVAQAAEAPKKEDDGAAG